LPSRRFWLGFIVLGVLLLLVSWFWADEWLVNHSASLRAWFDRLPGAVRLVVVEGLWLFYLGYGLVFLTGLARRDPRRLRAALAYLAAQMVFSVLVVRAGKMLLGRPRPFVTDPAWWWLTADPDHHALPSGHSADAAVGGVVTARFSGSAWLRAAALVLALAVALGRVVQGEHYPSDVVAGGLIGCLGGTLAAALFQGRLGQRLSEKLLNRLTRNSIDSRASSS